MSTVFVICADSDLEWTKTLATRLQQDGYQVSVITPSQSSRTIVRNQHSHLLVIVSPDSALGDAADWLENIWRPFLGSGGSVIPCLIPNAPGGAKNWMPFDLHVQVAIGFDDESAYQQLCARLGPIKAPVAQAPTSTQRPSVLPTAEAPSPTEVALSPRTLAAPPPAPPPPQQPLPQPQLPDLTLEPPRMNFISYVLSIVAGFALVTLIWWAALQQTLDGGPSLLLWLGGLALVLGSLFALGQIELKRRQRTRYVESRYDQARGYAGSQIKPPIYVEIIQSTRVEENGLIWEMRGETLQIGSRFDTDVPLVNHEDIASEMAMIFYENGVYYLENTSRGQTLFLLDQRLEAKAIAAINSGDLITMASVVLQFRIQEN